MSKLQREMRKSKYLKEKEREFVAMEIYFKRR